jgi:hypothetical protein
VGDVRVVLPASLAHVVSGCHVFDDVNEDAATRCDPERIRPVKAALRRDA